ncbi:MAG: beta galactosidase jelly roll domain-containing protein [Salinivirgaceae bacterium]|jgi:beta-galactosidase|nr:beta galactosidase jelly roll domain-containing protein [Salinivirgaceae bacterium]
MTRKLILFSSLMVVCLAFLSFNQKPKTERIKETINKNEWKFIRSDVKNAQKVKFNDTEWTSVTIPHDFNGGSDGVHNDVFNGRFDFKNDPDKMTMYKGPAWYRTTFSIDEKHENKRVFIEFEAVSLVADVWVNGKNVGQHKGGYTSFEFDVTDFIKSGSANTLAVRVDNSNDKTIAPWMADEKNSFPYSFDYAIYGGIYRDVWVTITDEIKIEKVRNTPVVGGQAPAVLTMDTYVKNYSKQEKEVTLQSTIIDPNGKEIATLKRKKIVAPNETIKIQQSESSLGELFFWSPDSPKTYRVISTLSYDGQEVDQYESKFGFRYFSLANNQPFMLNGKKTLIKGINRHQDMEGLGYALSNEQHVMDVKLIKDAGFNFVRHAHYPSDQAFANACRDMGIMLWLEIPLTGSTSDDPAFLENCKSQLTEMIDQHYNNPAVIIWGIGNESDRSGGGEDVSNKVFGELAKLSRKLDPNRTVTGCNYKFKSNQDLVDTYAPQHWGGWYSQTISTYNPKEIIGEYGADIDLNIRTNEIFDITKNYSAGGKPEMWSQEYGALLHEYKTSMGLAKADSFPGHFAWVAFDFASPRLGRGTNPIPYMNQKGLLAHDHKTKKDVYYFYQSMYRKASELPMLYIVPSTWSQNKLTEVPVSIWAYSNCDSVLLYNDYKEMPIGARSKNAGPRSDTRFQWDNVKLKNNVVYAEGWFNNEIVARDTLLIK